MHQSKKINFLLLFLTFFNCQNRNNSQLPSKNNIPFDILIQNGQIVDGSGTPAFSADILILSDTIAFIGKVDTSQISYNMLINAEGQVVTPGFIDAHAHGDPFSTPTFENFIAMGVTTICLGQDGSSPAAPIDQWMDKVAATPLGVNIAMFVGHGTLRKKAGINFSKKPSYNLLLKQQALLKKALDAGCFGMSTGLEYTPGIFADDEELIPLAKIVGEHKGLIMSHIRNEDDDQIVESIQELKRQGAHCKVQVSHIKSVYGKGKARAKELLGLLEDTNKTTHATTADVYPYTASYTGIGIVFPEWAKAPNDYKKVVKNRRAELLAHLKQRIMDRNGPSATLFGTAPYVGKTLAEVSKAQGIPYEKVLLGIGPNRASGAYFIMDDALQEEIIAHPKVMICSDGSPTMRHPRGYGSFAKIIEEYVLKRKRLSLEVAVHKMSSLTANTIVLSKRGAIKVGNYADILIFKPANVKAKATYANPHQLATGFEWVLVNGAIVRHKDQFLGEDSMQRGRFLRRE